jgi:hypothetical protein
MAYDPATGQIVVFGGSNLNGHDPSATWTWNGTDWTRRSPTTSPTGRAQAAMAYDPATGQLLLFGGQIRGRVSLNDTWSWDGSNWTQLFPSTSPTGRLGASMDYDAATGQLVLFGGARASDNFSYGDTWTWDGRNWMQMGPASSPSPRFGASMAYDPATSQLVLFGGFPGGFGEVDDDTWTWDGSSWRALSPPVSPPARGTASTAFDSGTGLLTLFGGFNPFGFQLGDTWTWDGTTWAQQSPASSPPAMSITGVADDTATGQFVLFGGENYGFPTSFSNQTWDYAPPPVVPSGTYRMTLTTDAGAAYRYQLTIHPDATWSIYSGSATPPVFSRGTMAWDGTTASWYFAQTFPEPDSHITAVAVGGRLLGKWYPTGGGPEGFRAVLVAPR